MLAGAWVVALLLAGAPFLAMMGGSGDDAEAGEDDAELTEPEESGVLQDMAAMPPTDYEYLLHRPGEHAIGGFRPGVDTLTLTSDSWDFDLFDLGHDGDGAGLRIDHGSDTSILRFRGLTALPLDDIFLKVTLPGTPPALVALRDALASEDPVLAPTDPDAPDDLPDDPSPDPGLPPADGESDEDEPPGPDGGAPLLPTDPDAPEDPP